MSYQKESFGMMDEGYFVPRGEIVDWINNLLDVCIHLISVKHYQDLTAWIRLSILSNR